MLVVPMKVQLLLVSKPTHVHSQSSMPLLCEYVITSFKILFCHIVMKFFGVKKEEKVNIIKETYSDIK